MTNRQRSTGALVLALYALTWGAATLYLARAGADWTFPVISLAVFGVTLSGLAWLLTRGAHVPALAGRSPGVELVAILVFLVLYAVLFLGWGLGAIRRALPDGRVEESGVLALKLFVHVALPLIILTALGVRTAPLFDAGLHGRKFWRTLLVMGAIILALLAIVSPSLRQIAGLNQSAGVLAVAAPLSFVWIALEAGLCEEFLYRAVLQARASRVLRSQSAGIVATSLIFALAHAPGLYLRGGPGVDGWSTDPIQVAAFTIATLSPLSLLFGVLYARTRSLLLVVLLHGCVDVLPNMAGFVETWF